MINAKNKRGSENGAPRLAYREDPTSTYFN
jgi:hypothetical protein